MPSPKKPEPLYLTTRQCRYCFGMFYNGDRVNGSFVCDRCQGKPLVSKSKRTDRDEIYIIALRKSKGL